MISWPVAIGSPAQISEQHTQLKCLQTSTIDKRLKQLSMSLVKVVLLHLNSEKTRASRVKLTS